MEESQICWPRYLILQFIVYAFNVIDTDGKCDR